MMLSRKELQKRKLHDNINAMSPKERLEYFWNNQTIRKTWKEEKKKVEKERAKRENRQNKDGTGAKTLEQHFAPRHDLTGSKSRVFCRREARRKSTFLSANVSGIRHNASRTGVFEETPQKTTAFAAAGATNARLEAFWKIFNIFCFSGFYFFFTNLFF